MVRVHVRAGGVIVESFEQNELVRVLNTAGPLEELIAFLGAGCLGESAGLLNPLVSVFGLDGELYSNENHRNSLVEEQIRTLPV